MEVTTINPSRHEVARDNREADICETLNRAQLPPDLRLGWFASRFGRASPPGNRLRAEVERWANDRADQARREAALTEAIMRLASEYGRYYVFSVEIPWTADAWELLTLDGIARGRSDVVLVEKGRPRSATDITLSPKHVIHPPILAALPLLVVQRLAGTGGLFPEWCERMLCV